MRGCERAVGRARWMLPGSAKQNLSLSRKQRCDCHAAVVAARTPPPPPGCFGTAGFRAPLSLAVPITTFYVQVQCGCPRAPYPSGRPALLDVLGGLAFRWSHVILVCEAVSISSRAPPCIGALAREIGEALFRCGFLGPVRRGPNQCATRPLPKLATAVERGIVRRMPNAMLVIVYRNLQ